ncbi:MAG: zinc ribbon-containing protein [Peptococcaceae bacterium]|nr:zinc ribbon-containing protein [Peptococcaceae bacterium]
MFPVAVAGKQPGKGAYLCVNCGKDTVLNDPKETLPACPHCNGVIFIKVG